MSHATILIVDDQQLIRWSLAERLRAEGYDVLEAENGAEALGHAQRGVDLVLLDYKPPELDGVTILRKLKKLDPDMLVILLTASTNVDTAVRAMKLGAYHFANKPFELDAIAAMVKQALETTRLRRECRCLRDSQAQPYAFDRIVGDSPQMLEFKALLMKIAASPVSTVLLTGERGTGKHLTANVLHYNSDRACKPFMKITCSALPETLLERELFGYECGAVDARQQKRGLLESAHGGTVFLDEIGELIPALQAKLLRFLEETSFKRVGGSSDIRVDVRVIVTTNRNLEEEVRANRLREDLFYRLNVLPIKLPPLRAHVDDVPALVSFYVNAFNREFKKNVRGVSAAAMRALTSYGWPGNVRELRNAVERAMLLAKRDYLEPADFPIASAATASGHDGFALPTGGVDLEQVERSLVTQALERAGWNQSRAATLLGINRDQVRYRVEKFGLTQKAATGS